MVGNDVVDLRDEEVLKGPTHPRFDARVFSRGERMALAASGAPQRLRWMLWAAKEAAYKLAKKRNPRTVFSPRGFVVHLDGSLTGEVEHAGGVVPVHISATPDAVHAIATESDDSGPILSGVAASDTPLDASRDVRELAACAVAERLRTPRQAIRIDRRGRIPVLEVEGVPFDLSLSHHGRFVAFACDLGASRA